MNSSLSSNASQALSFFERCGRYHLGPLMWSWFCMFSFLVAVPVSVKLLWELHQARRHKITNDFFLLNLTVMNLISTTLMPFIIFNHMMWHSLTFDRVTEYLYHISLSGKPLFMACICGDGYFAVVYPIAYRNSRESIGRKSISATVWLFAFSFSSVMFVVNWTSITPLIAVSMCIALPVITFCNTSIVYTLRKQDFSGQGCSTPQKKRFLDTVIASCIVSIFAYVPPVIIFPLVETLPLLTEELSCNLVFIGKCCSMFGCMSMPVLYLYNVHKLGLCKAWWRTLWA